MSTLRTSVHLVPPSAPSPAGPAPEPGGWREDRVDRSGQELLDLYLAIALVVPLLMFLKSLWS